MLPPLATVRERLDRRWTASLLALLATTPAGDALDDLVSTLEALDDPRAVAPLEALLEDLSAPAPARRAAGEVLRATLAPHPAARRRAWWRSGDEVLREHALGSMQREDADVLEPLAADDASPLQALALRQLCWGFDEPRFVALLVRALDHRDAVVRRGACATLLWDEPVAAGPGLLRAARDPDASVALAALDTLRYFATVRVLRELDALRREGDEARRAAAEDAFAEVQGSLRAALTGTSSGQRARLLGWLGPVVARLDLPAGPEPDEATEASPDTRVTTGPAPGSRERLDARAVEAQYADLDGEWADRRQRWGSIDWGAASEAERGQLTGFFLGHEDAWVREAAGAVLAGWGRGEALLTLLDDPAALVRKGAMYRLGQMQPASALVARRAWEYLHAPSTSGTPAHETLTTYVRHAPRREAAGRLAHLARHDERDVVRVHAIHELARLGARDEVASLRDLLDQAPRVTWAQHAALLDAARSLGLDVPGADALADVDDLRLQVALGRLVT
jgi:HEAT repeat protein